MKTRHRPCGLAVVLLCILTLCVPNSSAYSVLAHEELIDLAWADSIRPLLLAKFPGATEAQLHEAHAYAYGGSAIQDMGYYPFGKQFFSDLTHYVRSGDFIGWMFRNARTINEYAFAIGALAHYVGDSIGHSRAINPATAVEFPNLAQKFGNSVTYDQSPHGHIRTEFAFDVNELMNLEFAPPKYLEFIGFQVPRKFLEHAFLDTYGFDIHELLGRTHPALRSYQTSVRSFVPAFAEAEVVLHRHQFPPPPDNEAYRTFIERVKRTSYDRHWASTYRGPGVRAHLLAVLVFLVPKVGGASDLAIKIPNDNTLELYLSSVNHAVNEFRGILDKLRTKQEDPLALANVDLDTGVRVKREDYPLTDKTYVMLLERLTRNPNREIPRDLQKDVVNYLAGSGRTAGRSPEELTAKLEVLKKMQTIEELRAEARTAGSKAE